MMSCLQTAGGRWVHPFSGRENTMAKLSWYGTALSRREKKDAKVGAVFTDGDAIQVDQLLDRFSSWHSLKKFVAYILRYKTSLCKFCVRDKEKPVKPVAKSVIEPIRVPEVREKHFKEEIECLDGCCNCGSKATAQRRFS